MKFTAKHKTQLIASAYKTAERAKSAHKFAPALLASIDNLCATIRDKTESFPIQWVDQDGQHGEKTVGPMSAIKMLDGLLEVLNMVQASGFWTKFESSLELALLMADSVDGIGPSRAMAFKSLYERELTVAQWNGATGPVWAYVMPEARGGKRILEGKW